MTGLSQLPRMWLAVGSMLLASIAGGVTAIVLETGSAGADTKVLGERVTGSGSSTATPNASGGSSSGGNGQGNNGNGNGNGGSNGNTSPGHAFTITGAANGLFPGAVTRLYLTVVNPNNQAIRVTDLKATLSSVTGAPGCSASTSNLTIQAYTGQQFDVAQNGSAPSVGYIGLTLPSSVSNACQNATYNLSYTGTAVQK